MIINFTSPTNSFSLGTGPWPNSFYGIFFIVLQKELKGMLW